MDYYVQQNEELNITWNSTLSDINEGNGSPYFNYIIPLLFICSFFFVKLILYLYSKYFNRILMKPSNPLSSPDKANMIKTSIRSIINKGDFDALRAFYYRKLPESVDFFDEGFLFQTIFSEINDYLQKILPKDQLTFKILSNEMDFYLAQMNYRHSYNSTTSYNLQIEILLKLGKYIKAYQLLREMRLVTKPELSTYKLFFNNPKLSQMQFNEVYNFYKLDKLETDDKMKASLINLLSKNPKNSREIIYVFESLEQKPNISLDIGVYNIAMGAYFDKDEYDHCVGVFCLLNQNKIMSKKVNLSTHLLLTKAYCMLHRFEDAKRTTKIILNLYHPEINITILNSIAGMFYNANELDYSLQFLRESELKLRISLDINSYILMMSIYLRKTNEEKIIELYDKMIMNDIKPNAEIYKLMMKLFIKEKKIIQAIGVFIDIKINDIELTNELYGIIINACFIHGYPDKGTELILEAEENGVKLTTNDIRIGCDCYLNSINRSKMFLESQRALNDIVKRYGLLC